MKKNIVFLLSGLMLLTLAVSACAPNPTRALAQTTPTETPAPVRTISVNGTGRVTLVPDIAYIYIGVHTENASASEAVAANTVQANAVIAALKAAGIADKDLQTSNYSVYPQTEWGPNGERKGIIYVVDNSVKVTVRNLGALGSLLDEVTTAGANSISGISFDVENREAAYTSALEAAVLDAKAKADVLAGAAGVEVGQVQSIQTYSSTPIIAQRDMMAAEAVMGGGVSIQPGEMEISVDVSVVYAIQ